MMTPSVQTALRLLYTEPMLVGLPANTTWAGDPDHPLWWDAARDRYVFGLVTRIGDEYHYTLASIEGGELAAIKYSTSRYAWDQLVHGKLKLLRMRHYFGLAYRRGGYC